MKLRRLEIQILPGIHPGFAIEDFRDGVNCVVAPNAGGKSSLIRALEYLLAGTRAEDPDAIALAAEWSDDGTRWTVRRTGSSVVWEKNGQRADPPALPNPGELPCFRFSMEDLIHADAGDKALLTELRRTLSGGFDLDAVRKAPEFDIGTRLGHTQAKTLRDTSRKRRAIEADYQSLRREEARLPGLRNDLRQAEDAAVQAKAFAQALSLLDAREEHRAAKAGLEAFPAHMEKLRGDEEQRLEKLERKSRDLTKARDAACSDLAAAEKRLSESGLPDRVPGDADLETQTRELESIRHNNEKLLDAVEERDAADRDVQSALRQLGGSTAVPKLDPESISDAEKLALRIQELQRERIEVTARLTEGEPDSHDFAQCASAVEALQGWLNSQHDAPRNRRDALIAAAAAMLGLLATTAALVGGAWIAGTLAAAFTAAAGWMWIRLNTRGAASIFRHRFEQTSLPPPEAWNMEPVRSRLEELERRRTELREAELRARQAEAHRKHLETIEAKLAQAEDEKSALAERLGFDPGITAAGLDRLVRLVGAYDQAAAKRAAAEATIARLSQTLQTQLQEVRDFLRQWHAMDAIDGVNEGRQDEPACAAALARLKARTKAADEARRNIDAAKKTCADLEKQLAEVDDERKSLFADADLSDGDGEGLAQRCGQFGAWKKQADMVRDAAVREAERRAPLANHPGLLNRLETEPRETFEHELRGQEQLAERAVTLREEITRIETLWNDAGRDARLEQAAAEEQAAFDALEDALDQTLASTAAKFLLDGVREEYRTGHEPELLRDAREQFSRFTHHAFRLEIDPNAGFLALDCQQNALRELNELSSGTRMQLLLAMRLAAARRIERGTGALPLFFDEALTTSDERRFAEVARSLEELSRDDERQIVYLSARRHEVSLWERATGCRPHVIDLAEIRFAQTAAAPEDYLLPNAEPLPHPEGKTPEQYAAALRVPPVDPTQAPETVCVFHLLRDDLPLLHRLWEDWRVTTLGQLESLLASEAARHAIPESAVRDRLTGRCAIAYAWVDAWREGRGKSVDRIALERSGAVSATFIDQVSDLADELKGDAAALINALRDNAVTRFRSANTDQLEEWLTSEGHLDPAPVLDADGRKRRVLETTASRAPAKEIQLVIHWLEAAWQ